MSETPAGLEKDIEALRAVLRKLLEEEGDLSRLVTGAARLSAAIVQAERLRHQVGEDADDGEYP